MPERAQFGEPVEHWHAVSTVLGVPYEAFEFRQPGTLRTVTVKQFRVPVHVYDDT